MPSGSVDDSVTGQGHPQSMGHEIPVTPEGHKVRPGPYNTTYIGTRHAEYQVICTPCYVYDLQLEVYFYEDVENAGAVRDALLEGRITECGECDRVQVWAP